MSTTINPAHIALLASLHEAGIRTRKVAPAINYGGCCVWAAAVGRALERRGITARVIVRDWRSEGHAGIDAVRDAVRHMLRRQNNRNPAIAWNRNGVEFNHVGLEVDLAGKTWHVDAEGVFPAGNHPMFDPTGLYAGRLTVAEAGLLARDAYAWNTRFDRRLIPRVIGHITAALRRVRVVA